MVKRKIIWLRTAELDMLDIMLYYIERNKSKEYSTSLYRGISKNLKTLNFTISLPQKTSVIDLYYFTHNHISVFFTIQELNKIVVKFVIDERRDPAELQRLFSGL